MTLFDGAQGSPTGLGMFGGGGGAVFDSGQGGGLLAQFEQRMQNPLVAAALGASGGLLGANSTGASFGGALAEGLMGGAGGALGAARAKRQRLEEAERNKVMRSLLERYANLANTQQPQQAAQGPVFQQQVPQGPLFNAYNQIPGLQ